MLYNSLVTTIHTHKQSHKKLYIYIDYVLGISGTSHPFSILQVAFEVTVFSL